jgi:hypothetical protein
MIGGGMLSCAFGTPIGPGPGNFAPRHIRTDPKDAAGPANPSRANEPQRLRGPNEPKPRGMRRNPILQESSRSRRAESERT